MKLFKKHINLLVVILMSSIGMNAQKVLQDYVALKLKDDQLLVRWEPKTIKEWIESKKEGYQVTLKDAKGRVINTKIVRPGDNLAWAEYERKAVTQKFENVVATRKMFFAEGTNIGNDLQKTFDLGGDTQRQKRLELGFVMYGANYDFEVAKLTGLATELSLQPGLKYSLEINVNRPNASTSIRKDFEYSSLTISPEVPDLLGVWGNRNVNLMWSEQGKQKDFFAYKISRSEDGMNYTPTSDRPFMNTLGLVPEDSETLEVEYRDSVPENEKTYYYKLEGLDYFGDVSENSSVISGVAFLPLRISPIIEYANQTEDNRAHLRWYIPEEMAEKIESFNILHSSQDKGPFEILYKELPSEQREIMMPMEFTTNHYIVQAIPYRGELVSSNVIFVMGQDTIPPETPVVIGAMIDDQGIVQIEWEENKESDLWGYKVYKSNYKEAEFTILTGELWRDTTYLDTLDLKYNIEEVYYKLKAFDRRGNQSEFTDIITIQKPDIIPPSMAKIDSFVQLEKGVNIHWSPSVSEDVVKHNIFKKRLKIDQGWELVAVLEGEEVDRIFLDKDVEAGIHYVYTINAIDDADLKSKAANPKSFIFQIPEKELQPIVSFEHKINEKEKTVTLKWELDKELSFTKVLLYKGPNKKQLGRYKILNVDSNEFTESYDPDAPMVYVIKPYFENQKRDYYSEYLELNSEE